MSIGFHYDDIDMESMEKESQMYNPTPLLNNRIYTGEMKITPRSGLIHLCKEMDSVTRDHPTSENGSIIIYYE